MYLLVLLFSVFVGADSYLNLQKEFCRRYDTDCLTRVSNSFYKEAIIGDPSRNIKSLDPLHQEFIHGQFLTTDYKLVNSTAIGFKDCNVVNTKIVIEKNRVDFSLVCPRVNIFGAYRISGLLIIIPIEGNGDFNVDIRDYHIQVETGIKIVQADDGRKYLKYKTFKATGDLRGGMKTDLTNLFDGKNEELAQAAIKFANEQWRPVSKEFQGPILNANVRKIIKNLNKVLRKVPLDTFIEY